MQWRPRVSVAAVVECEGRFLMVEETIRGRDVINQPAGHLEDGESLVEAVRRETLEETRWRFEPQAVTGVYRYRTPAGDTFIRFCFTGAVFDHDAARAVDSEIRQVTWLGRDELEARRDELRTPMVLRCIDDYLAGTRYPLALLGDV